MSSGDHPRALHQDTSAHQTAIQLKVDQPGPAAQRCRGAADDSKARLGDVLCRGQPLTTHCCWDKDTRLSEEAGKSGCVANPLEPSLTFNVCLRCWLQVLHGVEQAALQDSGTAALPHNPDAALLVQLTCWAAVLVVSTGLTQRPAPLRLILNPLGLADDIAAGL